MGLDWLERLPTLGFADQSIFRAQRNREFACYVCALVLVGFEGLKLIYLTLLKLLRPFFRGTVVDLK